MLQTIKNKKAVIGIFGLGYIGLPRSIQFARKHFTVIGFDNDPKKIEFINKNKSYLTTVKNRDILNVRKKYFQTSLDFSRVKEVDVIIFCLPTPLKNNKPDLSQIINTWKKIKNYISNKLSNSKLNVLKAAS